MLRSLLLKSVPRAKAGGAVDFFIRYYPPLRRSVLKAMQDSGERDTRLLARSILSAQKTLYGKAKTAEFTSWPVLEKEQLRAKPDDFLNPAVKLRIPAATGGTTGVPLKLWRSFESIVAEQMFIDELLAPYGFSMRSKVAVLRADSIKATEDTSPPFGRISHRGKRLTLSSPHLNAQTIAWFHDAIRRFEPEVLWVYPSMGLNLMTLLQQANLSLSIPVILASSENLSASAHASLAAFFNCRVVNYYGQAERVCLAVSNAPGEFYFHPAYGKVELLSPTAASAQEMTVKIIATSYWNQCMPLVRYNTGDLLYLPGDYTQAEIEEVASGKRPFSAIAGRDNEFLVTREGMRIIGLNQIPREIKNTYQMQLVQTDPESLVICVLAMPAFNADDAKEIIEHARAKIPASIRVSVEKAERLQTNQRGKTPLVIRQFGEV